MMTDMFGFMILEKDGRLLGDKFLATQRDAWLWAFQNNAELILEAQGRGARVVRVRVSVDEYNTPSA